MKSKAVISVHGGLGNQLFLLGLATLLSDQTQVSLRPWKKGSRTDAEGKVWISKYECFSDFSRRNSLLDSFFVLYTRNCFRLLLRKQKFIFWQKQIQCLFDFCVWIPRLFGIQIVTTLELGDFCVPKLLRRNYFFVYFQTIKASIAIKDRISEENLANSLEILENLIVADKKIMVLHIRMGDYRLNPEMGVLGSSYFTEALEAASTKFSWDEIWLFSDEPHEAKLMLPSAYSETLRLIDDKSFDPIQTLALMCCGDAYILSNSSFGWWAANLSYKSPEVIVVPNPWFARLNEPKGLIPESWIRVDV